MSNADKTTIKLRSYPGNTEVDVAQSNLSDAQHNALELVKKSAQLEEEKRKSLEYQKTIEQLRDGIRQEQDKATEFANMALGLEDKLKGLAGLEAKVKQVADLEAKVRELTEVLGKISGIASAGKAD